MNMTSGMVVVLEKGFNSSMNFMQEIQKKGIQNNLRGWWWSSDKGLIKNPEDSDEMVVKAQTMYDAMTGKPVYVNGVRMFQTHSPGEIRQMIDVCQHDLLALGEPEVKKIEQPEEVEFPPLVDSERFSFENKETHTSSIEDHYGRTIKTRPILPPRDAPELPLRSVSDKCEYDNTPALESRTASDGVRFTPLFIVVVCIAVLAFVLGIAFANMG